MLRQERPGHRPPGGKKRKRAAVGTTDLDRAYDKAREYLIKKGETLASAWNAISPGDEVLDVGAAYDKALEQIKELRRNEPTMPVWVSSEQSDDFPVVDNARAEKDAASSMYETPEDKPTAYNHSVSGAREERPNIGIFGGKSDSIPEADLAPTSKSLPRSERLEWVLRKPTRLGGSPAPLREGKQPGTTQVDNPITPMTSSGSRNPTEEFLEPGNKIFARLQTGRGGPGFGADGAGEGSDVMLASSRTTASDAVPESQFAVDEHTDAPGEAGLGNFGEIIDPVTGRPQTEEQFLNEIRTLPMEKQLERLFAWARQKEQARAAQVWIESGSKATNANNIDEQNVIEEVARLRGRIQPNDSVRGVVSGEVHQGAQPGHPPNNDTIGSAGAASQSSGSVSIDDAIRLAEKQIGLKDQPDYPDFIDQEEAQREKAKNEIRWLSGNEDPFGEMGIILNIDSQALQEQVAAAQRLSHNANRSQNAPNGPDTLEPKKYRHLALQKEREYWETVRQAAAANQKPPAANYGFDEFGSQAVDLRILANDPAALHHYIKHMSDEQKEAQLQAGVRHMMIMGGNEDVVRQAEIFLNKWREINSDADIDFDVDGNLILLPEGQDGRYYYYNRPGFSRTDFYEFLEPAVLDAALTIPSVLGGIGGLTVKELLKKVAKSAVVAGGTSLGRDQLGNWHGAEGYQLTKALMKAGASAAGESVLGVGEIVIGKLIRRAFDVEIGDFTPATLDFFEANDIDPGIFDRGYLASYNQALRTGLTPENAAEIATQLVVHGVDGRTLKPSYFEHLSGGLSDGLRVKDLVSQHHLRKAHTRP